MSSSTWGCSALAVLALTLADADAGRRQPAPGTTVIEFESLAPAARASAGAVRVQDMRGFPGAWSGNAQLFWAPPAPIHAPIRNWPALTLPFTVAQAGTYRVLLAHTVAPDFGTMRIFVNGQPRQDVNGWAAGVSRRTVEIGEVALRAGTNQLVVTVDGKAAQSSNYFVGLDRLELQPIAAAASDPPPPVTARAAPAVEEAIVVDMTGGTGRLLKATGGLGSGNCWSVNRTFDVPRAAESFFYLGNFDRNPGDELVQWHYPSGDWFIVTFDAAHTARREQFARITYPTAGRSDRVAHLTGRQHPAGIVMSTPGQPVEFMRRGGMILELLPKAGAGVYIASIDADNDGRDEVLFYDEAAGTLDLLRVTAPGSPPNDATAVPAELRRVASGWGPGLRFATGDFDGDGRMDLLVHDTKTRDVSIASFDMSGRPGSRRRVASGWPASHWWTRAVDFDADGRDDLLVHNRSTGALALVRFTGPNGQAVASPLLTGLTGPDDSFYPGYFGAGPDPQHRAATFLTYERPAPQTGTTVHRLAHVEVSASGLQVDAHNVCSTNTPFPPQGVIFVGDFVPEAAGTQPPGDPAPEVPAASAWTPKDVVDSRIDVAAQRSLQRMLAGGPDMAAASAIVGAVKGGRVAGIYREDQQQPAMRAQKTGKGWWQLFAGQPPDRLAFCWREPAGAAPMIVMRRTVVSTPELDGALRSAWKECGLQ